MLVGAAMRRRRGPGLGAADLVDAWRAAQTHDPEFAAAQAARDAGQARREQGASLWRPTLQFSGTAGVGTNETSTTGARFSAPGFGTVDGASFDTSVTQGNLWRWSLQAKQPLSTANATPASASSSWRPTRPIWSGGPRSRR